MSLITIKPLAQFIGIVFPTLYAGFTISDSFTFIQPIINHAPNQKVMAAQWLHGYQYGPLWVPPLILPSTLSNLYLYLSHTSPHPLSSTPYLLASLLILSILPITFVYMEPGINGACKWRAQQLLQHDATWSKTFNLPLPETKIWMPSAHKHASTLASRKWAEKSDMKDLIIFWRKVNNFRWVIGGLAAVASGWATLSHMS